MVAKANWVFAHPRMSPAAYTRPEVVHAALTKLFATDPDLYVLMCGNSGLGVSTRRMARAARGARGTPFARRGYRALPRLHRGRVALRPTDETRYYRYQLSVGAPMSPEARLDPNATLLPEHRYWERVVTGWELMHADSVVLFPKLKTNVLAHGLSAALKLQGIGFLRDGDRLVGHDWNNGRRIADMLEVTDPDLVVTDAVDIGRGGNQMTQAAYRLGAVIVADNAVAHDAVCARILGFEPGSIPHLHLAAERGFGPLDLDAIDLVSEEPLERLATRARGFGPTGLIRVDEFPARFAKTTGAPFPLQIVAGEPYDVPGTCGVLLDWLYTGFDDPARRDRMTAWPNATVVVGDAAIDPAHPTVYLVGDRAIGAFRRVAAELTTVVRIPAPVRRMLRGLGAIRRYRLHDGRVGIAVEIPGEPPAHRDLILGFFFGSRGRLRASFLRFGLVVESYFFGTLAAIRRRTRNRAGIPVVHARKIARLRGRSWRLRWGEPARLKRRPPLPPLPEPAERTGT